MFVCYLVSRAPFRAWRLFRGLCPYIYTCLYLEALFTCLRMFVKFGPYIYVHMYYTVPVHNIYIYIYHY